MKNKLKRAMGFFLAAVMLLTMLPLTAFAADDAVEPVTNGNAAAYSYGGKAASYDPATGWWIPTTDADGLYSSFTVRLEAGDIIYYDFQDKTGEWGLYDFSTGQVGIRLAGLNAIAAIADGAYTFYTDTKVKVKARLEKASTGEGVLISDSRAESYSHNGAEASFDRNTGWWTPVADAGEDYSSFTIPLQYGDRVIYRLSGTVEGLGLYDWSDNWLVADEDEDGTILVTKTGEYTFYTTEKVRVYARVLRRNPTGADAHTHLWADEWSSDETHHWRECTMPLECNITQNSEKGDWAPHSFVNGSCVCGLTRATAVSTSPVSYGTIKVSWDKVEGATGYRILRAASKTDTYTEVKRVEDPNTVSTNISGHVTGRTYWFKVRPFAVEGNATKHGPLSAAVSGKAVPAAPKNVKTSPVSCGTIKVSWDAVNGANGYRVYRSEDGGAGWTVAKYVSGGSSKTANISGHTTGKEYLFKVVAYRKVNGENVFGLYSDVVPGTALPAAPKNVKTSPVSYGTIKVSWDAVSGANGYRVYRSEDGGASWTVAKYVSGGSSKTANISGHTTGKEYLFRVVAYRKVSGTNVFGLYSDVVPGTAIPAAPKSVRAEAVGGGAVRVSWEPVNGANGYRVYKSANNGLSWSVAKYVSGAKSSSAQITGLTPGESCLFKVIAYRKVSGTNIFGQYSYEVTVTPE